MRIKIFILSLLLLVQLGLALAMGLGGQNLKAFDATENLLSLDKTQVDHLVFEGTDGQKLVLQKNADHWRLPDHYKALADDQKIEDLLTSLSELRRPWPVAEKGTAHKRFKVADDTFERRLTFFHGEKELGGLLLGSSPGFRKVHARVAGEELVYDIPFSNYQVSLKPEDWLDKGQLKLKAEQIKSITLADCRLRQQDKKLVIEGLSDTEQTQAAKASELLNKLANLTIIDVIAKPEQSLATNPELSIDLKLADGRDRSYRFYQGAADKELQLQVSDQPWLYKLSPGMKDELGGFTRAALVEARAAEAAAAATN